MRGSKCFLERITRWENMVSVIAGPTSPWLRPASDCCVCAQEFPIAAGRAVARFALQGVGVLKKGASYFFHLVD